MNYRKWIRHRKEIEIIPTKWVWGLWFFRRVPVRMIGQPISTWLKLRNVVFDINYAPYILSVYLDIPQRSVFFMPAGRVIALYNHIHHQTKKCNRIFENIQSVLLQLDLGVDISHFEGLDAMQMIYDFAGGDILKGQQIENLTFAQVMNWQKVVNAYIRVDQDRYVKDKAKIRAGKQT